MDIKLYERVATVEEKVGSMEESVDKLANAVDHLTNALESSKGSLRALAWVISGATALGGLINWGLSLWHKS